MFVFYTCSNLFVRGDFIEAYDIKFASATKYDDSVPLGSPARLELSQRIVDLRRAGDALDRQPHSHSHSQVLREVIAGRRKTLNSHVALAGVSLPIFHSLHTHTKHIIIYIYSTRMHTIIHTIHNQSQPYAYTYIYRV